MYLRKEENEMKRFLKWFYDYNHKPLPSLPEPSVRIQVYPDELKMIDPHDSIASHGFDVGERVAIYDGYMTKGKSYGIIDWIDGDWVVVSKCNFWDKDIIQVQVHSKQCRKLKKK
jgi:hypothetical protein